MTSGRRGHFGSHQFCTLLSSEGDGLFMILSRANLAGVRGWSRAARLTLFTVAIVLTIAFMAGFVFLWMFVLLSACSNSATRSVEFCSDNGKLFLELLGLALLLAVALYLTRNLVSALGIDEEPPADRDREEIHKGPIRSVTEPVKLPLGQTLVSGIIEFADARRHRIIVNGLVLRFWGGYALRRGWIRNGDRGLFVYQRDPLCSTNFVLAFSSGGSSPVRGVGGVTHASLLALAVVGASAVLAPKPNYPAWLIPLCGALFVVSLSYLLLLLTAKRALYAAVSSHRSAN